MMFPLFDCYSLLLGTATMLLAATDEPGFLVTLGAQTWLWTKVALGIGLVVFVHELGHFVAAKTFGVKCEKFYVGFDVPIQIGPIKFPRTLGKFTYGETEYGIGIIPLGGYVKMLGQDDDPRKAEEEAKRIRVGDDDNDFEDAQLDPRSYPAKTVWQRMIIISAGVVMNVITGVMFATVAYMYGVPFTPAVVGGVAPGGPAWQAGIEPGGRVLSVADLEDDTQLHFNEMKLAIVTEGMDAPDEAIDVRLSYGDDTRDYQLKTASHPLEPSLRMIGISGPQSDQLAPAAPVLPGSAAASVLSDADGGATVVGFDQQSLDAGAVMPVAPLLSRIQSAPGEPIELTLVSEDGEKRSVTLPPQPEKDFGLRFGVGPIAALIQGGPADSAGLQVGDQITAINGDEAFDAYTLLLSDFPVGEPVEIMIRRGEGESAEEKSITVTPVEAMQTHAPTSELGEMMGTRSLGLAYKPIAKINKVVADGSKIQAGDIVQEISIRMPSDEVTEGLSKILTPTSIETLTKGWEIGPSQPLGVLMDTIQVLPTGTEVMVVASRPPEGTIVEDTLVIGQSDRFWYDRGLNFTSVDSIQTADSFGAAISLGLREGWRRLGNVGRFLGMLVTGKVQPKFLGGPVRIFQMAGAEAERGISAQLLFLTMLSMNLAIINFLPIPALDGGHMMFLTAEAIRGRRVDEALEMRLTLVGVAAILCLMIFVFANDLIQLGS